MMRAIYMHGALGARFGREVRLDVASPAEAVRALSVMLPGWRAHVEAGAYQVFRGRRGAGVDLAPQELHVQFSDADTELHIVPAATGAKREGLGKVLAGTLLIAASFVIPGAWAIAGSTVSGMVAQAGVAMALTGVGQMLSPRQSARGQNTKPAVDPSDLFSGPVNVAAPGGAVPVVVGLCEVGSVVVSAAIHVEDRA